MCPGPFISGYEHIMLAKESSEYFGIEWRGLWWVCTTLPLSTFLFIYIRQLALIRPTSFDRKESLALSMLTTASMVINVDEKHWVFSVSTDASLSRWAGAIHKQPNDLVLRDFRESDTAEVDKKRQGNLGDRKGLGVFTIRHSGLSSRRESK